MSYSGSGQGKHDGRRDDAGGDWTGDAEDHRTLVVGCASTGAKFTPLNHRPVGDEVIDDICSGTDIPATPSELAAELRPLYDLGCRYYHYHARDFSTREQTTENAVYQEIGRLLHNTCPGMLVSFGSSRNGRQVRSSIAEFGEWERTSQSALPLHLGGAHFVTMQAAAELQVICDFERQKRSLDHGYVEDEQFVSDVASYAPSRREEDLSLEVSSTAQGAAYGRSSADVQFGAYKQAIRARSRLLLLHEVEWVQWTRSYAMTRLAIEHPELGLGKLGQLNVVVLFGFSPRLPFPGSYEEFRTVIETAKRLERAGGDGQPTRKVTITVGAAVMPRDASGHIKEMDVGRFRGERMCAVRRLAGYAAQPGSGVDLVRTGMEDTPYEIDEDGNLSRTTNVRLVEIVAGELRRNGVGIERDPVRLAQRFGLTDLEERYRETVQAGDVAGLPEVRAGDG